MADTGRENKVRSEAAELAKWEKRQFEKEMEESWCGLIYIYGFELDIQSFEFAQVSRAATR